MDLEQVMSRYGEMVYRLAYARMRSRADADDVFQEVFLRYFRRSPRVDSEEHLRAWLVRVTLNCCKSLWLSPFRRNTQELPENLPVQQEEGDSPLEECLDCLDPDYRVVIHLFYYEELSTGEIARLLNRRESTVRVQLTRARRRLRELMEGERI